MKGYDPSKPYKADIAPLIQQTWQTPYVSVQKGIYPIVTRRSSYPEIDHTDGIGTKGFYHWQQRTFAYAAQDALAMNLNDLALTRAVPYKLQNHIILPQEDRKALFGILEALVKECRNRNIAMTGGETSIHDNMQGMDLSITMSGFIPAYKENALQEGDMVFGIASNGLHSNGFTKVRELFGEEYREEFTAPTRIYLDDIFNLEKAVGLHGMMHITGGAFTKLKDISKGLDVVLEHPKELAPHSIFQELYQKGLSDAEMYQTFNCGIGFVFSLSAKEAETLPLELGAVFMGTVRAGSGQIVIDHSAFGGRKVIF